MAPLGPVFISYSRKDYYFAESLAVHLLRRGVPAWLDVKDLIPGNSWEQQLDDALDRASAVVVVASPGSLTRPNVRKEWERARTNGKRIIVAHFRGSEVPEELAGCEAVDFRGAFGPALKSLAASLEQTSRTGTMDRSGFVRLPPWVAAMLVLLSISLAVSSALADWGSGWAVLFAPALLLGFAWFFCYSFLRRRMGMTRLFVCLGVFTTMDVVPLTLSLLGDRARLASFSPNMVSAATYHQAALALLGAIPVAGLAIVLLARPEDLLRWTPTGKAWSWYRSKGAAELVSTGGTGIMGELRRYRLFHDPVDERGAAELRRCLSARGASEVERDGSAVLLLTNRTRTDWLAGQSLEGQASVVTIVASAIALPESLDWLWRHQWIDFRRWDAKRLDGGRRVLPVPEALSGPRYPRPVRVAHHLLCALATMVFVAMRGGSQEQPDSPTDTAITAAGGLACYWCAALAHRLLRRSVTERAFRRRWPIRWGAMAVAIAAAVLFNGAADYAGWLALSIGAAYLVAFPLIMIRVQGGLTFWFPAEPGKKSVEALQPPRNWQTLIWVLFYAFLWIVVRGRYA